MDWLRQAFRNWFTTLDDLRPRFNSGCRDNIFQGKKYLYKLANIPQCHGYLNHHLWKLLRDLGTNCSNQSLANVVGYF